MHCSLIKHAWGRARARGSDICKSAKRRANDEAQGMSGGGGEDSLAASLRVGGDACGFFSRVRVRLSCRCYGCCLRRGRLGYLGCVDATMEGGGVERVAL